MRPAEAQYTDVTRGWQLPRNNCWPPPTQHGWHKILPNQTAKPVSARADHVRAHWPSSLLAWGDSWLQQKEQSSPSNFQHGRGLRHPLPGSFKWICRLHKQNFSRTAVNGALRMRTSSSTLIFWMGTSLADFSIRERCKKKRGKNLTSVSFAFSHTYTPVKTNIFPFFPKRTWKILKNVQKRKI